MSRFHNRNGTQVPYTAEEEAARDAEEAAWTADAANRAADQEEARKDRALLTQSRMLWVIETLLGELEAIRRGDPPTQRAITLRNRINNL